MSEKFRFEDLRIWKEAIRIALVFFKIADTLEEKKLWRFADQCRGVGMSIPNNISESTGTLMVGEQQFLLRVSKRECFEAANILVLLQLQNLITLDLKCETYDSLFQLSKQIESYSRSLK